MPLYNSKNFSDGNVPASITYSKLTIEKLEQGVKYAKFFY